MTTGNVRGVWRAVCLSREGFPILEAVTADNRKIAEHTLMPFESEQDVADRLMQLLDDEDPIRMVA